MFNKIILTKEGLTKLKKELDSLVNLKRPEVAKRIHQAKDYGDLSENVEHDEAKNEQLVIDKRISELRKVVKRADVPSPSKKGEAGIGSKVAIDCEGEKTEYTLVGDFEADPGKGMVSHSSPIGQSLIGGRVGERIKIETPSGTQECQIVSIK